MPEYPEDSILVLAELSPSGVVQKSTAEVLGAAAQIGTPVAMVVTAPGESAAVAEAVAALGAVRVLTVESDALTSSLMVPLVDALAAAVDLIRPEAVLIVNSVQGRDAAARLAARTSSALAVDAVNVSRDEEGVVAHHSVYGGAYNVESAATVGVFVVTVRQGAVDVRADSAPLVAEALEVTPSGLAAGAIDGYAEAIVRGSRPELRGAQRVVAGGRGLGSQEKFVLVEQLADALSAAVGASRAAVDSGYISSSHQVGQTGVSVSPEMYVALGISGAIQHRAGMQTAKTIIAINKDGDAPIFEIADFGIVGDIFTVVPQLVNAIEERKK